MQASPLVRPCTTAIGREILAIAAGPDVRLALVRLGHDGIDAVRGGIVQRRLLAVEPQPDLGLGIRRGEVRRGIEAAPAVPSVMR